MSRLCVFGSPEAPCSCIVRTWALKGLPYHDFGVYVYAIKLNGAFLTVLLKLCGFYRASRVLCCHDGPTASKRSLTLIAFDAVGVQVREARIALNA